MTGRPASFAPLPRSSAGRCVVTTRPAGQAEGLAAELAQQGFEALNFPVIEIVAADSAPLRVLDLTRFDLAFFVSPNAVEHAFKLRPLEEWPPALRLATVGPGSALVLALHGCTSVIRPQSGFDSEAVLALPEFSAAAMAGRRVLIVRGEGGREVLAESLHARGAEIEYVSVYGRRCARLDPAPLVARFAAGELAALVFTASEGLRFFLEITGDAGREMLACLPSFAPHPRICEALRAAGAPAPVLTAAGDAGIAHCLTSTLPGVP